MTTVDLPVILRSEHTIPRKKRPPRMMRWLIASNNIPCHYCAKSQADTLDHIVARIWGGPTVAWNLTPACQPCNKRKGGQMPICSCGSCQAAMARWLRDIENLFRSIPKPVEGGLFDDDKERVAA